MAIDPDATAQFKLRNVVQVLALFPACVLTAVLLETLGLSPIWLLGFVLSVGLLRNAQARVNRVRLTHRAIRLERLYVRVAKWLDWTGTRSVVGPATFGVGARPEPVEIPLTDIYDIRMDGSTLVIHERSGVLHRVPMTTADPRDVAQLGSDVIKLFERMRFQFDDAERSAEERARVSAVASRNEQT